MIMSDSKASRIATSGERQSTGQSGGNHNPKADPPDTPGMVDRTHPRCREIDPDGSCGATGVARSLSGSNDATVGGEEVEQMRDDLDHRLHDAVALDEIDLYADVLSAVAAADRPLTDDELDAVLGLDHTQ